MNNILEKNLKAEIGIGVDIEDIKRFEKLEKDKGSLKKIYTYAEIKYCFSKVKPSQHLAVRFSGKEAVIKALRGLGYVAYYSSIEILNDKLGVPKVRFLNKNLDRKFDVKISISHCKDKAIAFVVVLTKY